MDVIIRSSERVAPILDMVRKFREKELEPIANEVEHADAVPDGIRRKMGELGLFGLTVPEEYGGSGLSCLEYCYVSMELAKTHQAFRTLININNGIGSRGLVVYGTEEQKSQYLPRLASGELIAAFGLSEPEAGSDVAAITTRATRVDGGHLLNGTKQFVTNGPYADLFVMIAVTDPEAGARGGFTAFLVDGTNPGLRRGKAFHKMGFKGSGTSQVFLEDCFVPTSHVLGPVGRGYDVAVVSLHEGRLAVSAGAVGMAEHVLSLAVQYAKQRKQFRKRLAEHQGIQFMVADMATKVEVARTMLLATASRRDQGEEVSKEVAMTKLFCTEMACEVADHALQIHGGYGYLEDYAVERFYRDLRLLRIVEGTSEIQRVMIARRVLA